MAEKKIALVAGHSVLKSGACTSANGIINEYQYCKELTSLVAKYIKAAKPKWDVVTIVCPEKTFLLSSQEKKHKLGLINGRDFDAVYEFHLNSYNGKAAGTEQLYVSEAGKKLAQQNQVKLKTVFGDRGVKKRTDLYMLNKTDCPAVICETFFCDNAGDVEKGENKNAIARLYAEAITGVSIPADALENKVATNKIYGKIATKKDPLRMRQKASGTSKILQTIPKGAKVEILAKGKSWHKCKYNGMIGYCSAKYVTTV